MNSEVMALLTLGVIAIASTVVVIWLRRRPRAFDVAYYERRWKELQKLCNDKTTWKQAIIEADDLLDIALKRKKVRGKSTGERLVKVQREFTDNDGLWYGHKMRREIDSNPKKRIKETEVKKALLGIRQALKDIGALKNGKA